MTIAIASLLPSLLLIALGFGIVRSGLMSDWEGVERLNYYLLYPALLFVSVVRADLASAPIAAMASAMALGVLTIAALMAASRPLWMRARGVDGPAFTSHMQGAIRYNTAVALAITGAMFGREGLALTAIGTVVVVPLVNVICVMTLATHAPTRPPTLRGVLVEIALNPLIIATALGAIVNASHVPIHGPVLETFDLLGKGALGLALLLVGAGLKPTALKPRLDVAANVGIKLLAMTAAMTGFAIMFGVEGVALAAVILSGAVPTAGSSYVLARRMAGDADLMAGLITAQTLVAFITLPAAAWLAGGAAAPP